MGMAKRAMEAQTAQGWSYAEKCVCQRCVDESALCAAIAAQEDPEESCSFCGSAPAAPLDALLGPFVVGLRRLYDSALDVLSWNSREGGYQGPTIDTWDLIGEFDGLLVGDGLVEAVREALDDDEWVAKDWAIPAVGERLTEAWDRFCQLVKYETRYVIWRKPATPGQPDPGEIDPARILDAVGDLVTFHTQHLTAELDVDRSLWRARTHGGGKAVGSAKELGTTPVDHSRNNRMSPAGIPMFYGAFDPDTAVAEGAQGKSDPLVTVGAFQVTGPALLLDLTRLKPVPSVFAADGDERGQWQFLHYFERSLRAKPTTHEIDYIPTQIVTEYFLKVFEGGQSFDGIQYMSDVVNGQVCVVLDIRNEACLDGPLDAAANEDFRVVLDPATVATRRL